MMTTNRWKLGLFMVTGTAVLFFTVFWLGAAQLGQQTILCVTYFDESVDGLAVGQALKFRGVQIGKVVDIGFAPSDKQKIPQVVSKIQVERLSELGLLTQDAIEERPLIPKLRAQLVSQGITGLKWVQLDIAGESDPMPHLLFEIPTTYDIYVPAKKSVMESVLDALTTALANLPEYAEKVENLTGKLDEILGQFKTVNLPRAADTLLANVSKVAEQTETFMTKINKALDTAAPQQIAKKAGDSLAELDKALKNINKMLEGFSDDTGPIRMTMDRADELIDTVKIAVENSRVPATVNSFRDVAEELELVLQELRRASGSMRRLADELRRSPSSLLRGRVWDPGPGKLREEGGDQ